MRFHDLFFLAAFTACPLQLPAEPIPLVHAHAHNDYEHERPLFDALDHGFCSVEADIFLTDGKLLVAHDPDKLNPERSLESLYLDPLRERVKKNGGRVYPGGPEFTLLIDLKTSWTNTWPVLRRVLEKYSDVLTVFRDGKKETNAITIIITGDGAKEMFAGEKVRFAAYDGKFSDLDSTTSPDLIPWISAEWPAYFSKENAAPLPDDALQRLKKIVTQAHQHGRKLRFWAAPDNPAFWKMLLENDIDLINTDHLAEVETFFRDRKTSSSEKRFELSRADYEDRVEAAWTAQIIACLMGFQFEHKVASTTWVDQYPKNYDTAPVDDDWYYEMCAIRGFENYGVEMTVKQLGEQWKKNSCGSWGSSEQARLLLERGLDAPDTGHPRYNKFWFSIGSQFSADVYGLLAPGQPNLAGKLARNFGHLNGYAEGTDGAVFMATMVSLAFVESDPKVIVKKAAQMIHPDSPYRKCLDEIISMAEAGKSAREIADWIEDRWHIEYPWTNNAVPNG
ncbi:MAG: phosphatidylinositol-specific phospholipase C/glycerophosphodiester phosphodiesterase family protein, partial [Verrucomicrobiota bacterium]